MSNDICVHCPGFGRNSQSQLKKTVSGIQQYTLLCFKSLSTGQLKNTRVKKQDQYEVALPAQNACYSPTISSLAIKLAAMMKQNIPLQSLSLIFVILICMMNCVGFLNAFVQFGLFIRPLFESYDSSVITTNEEKFCQSLLMWLKDHCNLFTLRKGELSSLSACIFICKNQKDSQFSSQFKTHLKVRAVASALVL